jgi:hypothetical protein
MLKGQQSCGKQNIVAVTGNKQTVAWPNRRNKRFIAAELIATEENAVSTGKYMNRMISFMETNKEILL